MILLALRLRDAVVWLCSDLGGGDGAVESRGGRADVIYIVQKRSGKGRWRLHACRG